MKANEAEVFAHLNRLYKGGITNFTSLWFYTTQKFNISESEARALVSKWSQSLTERI